MSQELVIQWEELPTYNTIMSVAAGIGLLLLVWLGYALYRRKPIAPEGWALAFAVPGLLLTITGAHMTLAWPLAPTFPYDNIIFGEPAFAFGVLLLAAAVFLWRRGAGLVEVSNADEHASYLRTVSLPVSLFAAGMGLACFGIAAAGIQFELFAAPPAEPLSGNFADHPLVEAIFISTLYALTGLGAVLFPLALRTLHGLFLWGVGICWTVAGLAFLIFGALNYYTHIGLIVHTMPTGGG